MKLKVLLLSIVLITGLVPVMTIASSITNSTIENNQSYSAIEGKPGQDLPYSTSPTWYDEDIYQCQDPALLYINCDEQAWTGEVDQSITIAVIDDGLYKNAWEFLEFSLLNVDIIGYVTTFNGQSNDESRAYFYDSPNDPFVPSGHYPTHAFGVISLLSLVAGINVKVILLDVQTSTSDPYGFQIEFFDENQDYNVLDWIDQNAGTYGIDVVSMSLGWTIHSADVFSKSADLVNKGITLITSAGNENSQWNDGRFYPGMYDEWIAVGSVSHENRGKTLTRYVCEWVWYPYIKDCYYESYWDADYYSDKNARTGSEACPGCDGSGPWGSSWGTTSYSDFTTNGNGIDFVMPGNGVPVLTGTYQNSQGATHFNGIWTYSEGTSYSAPLLTGAVIAIIDGYLDGSATTPSGKLNPSTSLVYSLLKQASSRTSWNAYLGWGYINIDNAYDIAFAQGVSDGQVCYGSNCVE